MTKMASMTKGLDCQHLDTTCGLAPIHIFHQQKGVNLYNLMQLSYLSWI